MSRVAASRNVQTYLPDNGPDAQIIDFVRALESSGGKAPATRPALVAPDGTRLEFPEAMYNALRQVAEALSSGMGVTVAPMNALLTTQEAAEFLGVTRPTLVRILERGDIPMEKPGRHRFVRLEDLIAYQQRLRDQRRSALEDMVTDALQDDLYTKTDRLPPRTR